MMIFQGNTVKTLIIEDNEVDLESFCRVFPRVGTPVELHVVNNGIEALNDLYDQNVVKQVKLIPDLMIMDINMLKMNGIEFLKRLHTNTPLAVTKVVVLTTSDNDQDILNTFKLHIHEYLTKPIQVCDLTNVYKSARNM